MQIALHLDAEALDAYTAHLERLAERVNDATPAMRAIADDIHLTEAEAFATGGSMVAMTGAWVPDSDAWVAAKTARNRDHRTLVYTGTLERSLISRDAKYSLDVVGPDQLTVGTLDPVAHLHQGGTGQREVKTWRGEPMRKPRSAGRLPPRPVMQPIPENERRWSNILTDYLTGEVGL